MMQRDDKFKETPKLQSNDLMALLHSGSFTYRVLANNCQVLIACLHPLTIHLQPDGLGGSWNTQREHVHAWVKHRKLNYI